MSDFFVPQDEDIRRRINDELDQNLYVEAGAGTGKTSSLVNRIVALISSGRTTLDRVAAITFTDAAASELRDRIRETLERAASDDKLPEQDRIHCDQGVADLDRAAIETLHSFAGALLRERPLEAGLPPSFETMNQIAADLAFEDAWGEWIDSALDDKDLQPALRQSLSLGLTLNHLHQLAKTFHANYDRLEGAVFVDQPPVTLESTATMITDAPELERLCEFSFKGDEDLLLAHVRGVVSVARRLQQMDIGSTSALRVLSDSLPIRYSRGRVGDWDTDPESGQNSCTRLKDMLRDLDDGIQADLDSLRSGSLPPLIRGLQEFVLTYAADRKIHGRAEFQDLLVWARNLLRDNLEARDHFRAKYSHILLDEAQDTDPLQAEIATFLAEDSPLDQKTKSRPADWSQVPLAPGKLFVVGDPKQAIYRFRGADMTVMARFRSMVTAEPLRLVQNFRSQKPLVEWVNHLFHQWMIEGADQPEYIPIHHRWEPNIDHSQLPSVWALGGPLDERNVGPVRIREASKIASLIRTIRTEEWPVLDQLATSLEGSERFRPAELKDICILMPQRSALRSLELALENAGVPFRLEGASLVFETQEVRDLLNCFRAIDDPANQVALVAALRSPALSCSDTDLLEFVESGGRLDYLSERNPIEGPVASAFAVLRNYHQQRVWTSPAALIEGFLREQKLMEAAVGAARPREHWRRYAFLVSQARAFAEAGGSSLRAFLEWTSSQADEGVRVTEVPVPEADEDAVRVMTVHSAKGLEFPIVVLTALNFAPSARVSDVLFNRDTGSAEIKLGTSDASFQTSGYEALAESESEKELAEDVRLMYVATTRARDHLVLSLFRTKTDQRSRAALINQFMEDSPELWRVAEVNEGAFSAPVLPKPESDPEDTADARRQWIEERAVLIQDRSHPTSVAATSLAQVAKEETDAPEEPWRRGRAGTNVGRAVHAVLQSIDLSTGQGLEDISRAQAAGEGLFGMAAEVEKLAKVALESETIRRAVASGRWWREVPVAAPIDGTIVEGFIDLLFEEDGELVVVDYKTDSLRTDEEIAARTSHYRIQIGAYAMALQAATGRSVKEAVFLFLQPKSEVILHDIDDLVSEARQALSASKNMSA